MRLPVHHATLQPLTILSPPACRVSLCVGPPEPPREPVTGLYGKEDGLTKSSNPELLLDPPIALQDDLFHLRDKTRPETLAHIEAENAFAAAAEAESPGWRRHRGRVLQRLTAPSPPPPPPLWHGGGQATGGRAHCRRVDPARGPYPVFCGRGGASERVLLDSNAAPALLASEYMPDSRFLGAVRGLSFFAPSPSGRLVAYTVDTTGGESYTLMVLPPVDRARSGLPKDTAPCTRLAAPRGQAAPTHPGAPP